MGGGYRCHLFTAIPHRTRPPHGPHARARQRPVALLPLGFLCCRILRLCLRKEEGRRTSSSFLPYRAIMLFSARYFSSICSMLPYICCYRYGYLSLYRSFHGNSFHFYYSIFVLLYMNIFLWYILLRLYIALSFTTFYITAPSPITSQLLLRYLLYNITLPLYMWYYSTSSVIDVDIRILCSTYPAIASYRLPPLPCYLQHHIS